MQPVGLITAGGESRRMGRDKALLALGGRPLIAHVATRVAAACSRVVIIDRRPDRYAFLGWPVVCDAPPGVGPLGGLRAGLLQLSEGECGFLTACDAPFVEPRLIARLVELCGPYDAAIPVVGGWEQPLCAVYRRGLLDAVDAALVGSGHSLIRMLRTAGHRVRWVDEADVQAVDPALRSFIQLNTPEDYERARRLIHDEPASR